MTINGQSVKNYIIGQSRDIYQRFIPLTIYKRATTHYLQAGNRYSGQPLTIYKRATTHYLHAGTDR